MTGLSCSLFGTPTISVNQTEVTPSYTKIAALLYYLILRGEASREEVATLLWGDKNPEKARKNLRNTIYQTNRELGIEAIISPNRSILAMNPDIDISCDVQLFLSDPLRHLHLFKGKFLENFYIKNCPEFDLWTEKIRFRLEKTYLQACQQLLDKQEHLSDLEGAENLILRMINMDEFNEDHYLSLMKLYLEVGQTRKIIETYHRLAQLLDRELGIGPGEAIKNLYYQVVRDHTEKKDTQLAPKTDYFYGRIEEIHALEHFLASVLETGSRAFFLHGEVGSGKRSLVRQVLANQGQRFSILQINCLPEDLYKPYSIWRKLSYSYQWLFQEKLDTRMSLEETRNREDLIDGLEKTCKKQAILFLIEDAHWMDKESLQIVLDCIHALSHAPVAFLLTKNLRRNKEMDYLEHYLSNRQLAERLELKNLSFSQSQNFLQEVSQQAALYDIDQIYHYSQGNLFLLDQYAQQIKEGHVFHPLTAAIRSKMALQVHALEPKEEELLNYLSTCSAGSDVSLLTDLMGLSHHEMVALIDQLTSKSLILQKEVDDRLEVQFRQAVLGEFLYDQLPLSKRRILHEQIAFHLIQKLQLQPNNSVLLLKIARHFTAAKQPLMALEYRLHHLNLAIKSHYDLFPLSSSNGQLSRGKEEKNVLWIQEQLAEVRETMAHLEKLYGDQRQFQLLQVRFEFYEGRYYIRIGNYQKGVSSIRNVIARAHALHNQDYLLKGYRQFIHYCIQIENKTDLGYYAELGLETAIEANNHEAIGMFLRFKGLFNLMLGDEEKASRLLYEAIDCFSLTASMRKKYAIQIAAALDYLAEMAQIRRDFLTAIHLQKDAIELVQDQAPQSSTLGFYIGLGTSYYHLQDFAEAHSIFQAAMQEVNQQIYPWKEVQLKLYLALLGCQKHDYAMAHDLLDRKDALISLYSNPRDKGMIYYLMAKLKNEINDNPSLKEEFTHKLENDFSHYYHIAKQSLNPYRDRLLLEDLENFMKATK
ncbi:AAA family ATPase [Streptococcus sp. SS-4456]|uniref:AAA family ATPase n=1 Tax=Streptococcus sp. SS-4456 TaxID=3072286 RepID=UPI002FC5AB43